MSKFIDYYDILGVSPDASEKEIIKAYRKLAQECHPDKTSGLPEEERKRREERFIVGTEGYETLKDKKKKASYDAQYQLYQSKKEQNSSNDDIPFWEQPNWGGYSRRNRDNNDYANQYDFQYDEDDYDEYYEEGTDYYGMSDIMREAFSNIIDAYYDVKEEEFTISERAKEYRKIFKHISHPTILKKGFIIFGSEILYSAEKLKLKKKDDMSHYIIRNRGKALIAAGLAATLITGLFTSSEEKKPEPPVVEEPITENISATEPTLTIKRTYTVGVGDTLSGLAEDANCTRQEIKNLNNMDNDILYYKDTITVPYHIPQDEIGRYTAVELYNGENLYDFAETYETDPESLQKLNPDTIIEVNDSYAITSDTIVVPTFAPYDYSVSKAK